MRRTRRTDQAREAGPFGPIRMDLVLDGLAEQAQLYWLLVANTRSYGGVAEIASTALANDGLLDVCLFDGSGLSGLLKTVAYVVLRRTSGKGGRFRRFSSIEVQTAGLEVQADGEYIGETPMLISVVPQALPV